jgi:hypothetical protein
MTFPIAPLRFSAISTADFDKARSTIERAGFIVSKDRGPKDEDGIPGVFYRVSPTQQADHFQLDPVTAIPSTHPGHPKPKPLIVSEAMLKEQYSIF